MGIKALLLLPAILAFPGYLHGVAALPGTLPGPDTLYRDSTYLRVINEGSTRLNCYLSYPQGGWRVESTYGNNSSELARLARFIRTSLSDSLIYVREITLTGYCSIEGSYAHNERLARRRANGFRNYLDSVFGLSRRYPVRTSYVGEDWERLRSLADSCASLPSRREVLEIIDNTGIFDGRERKLMALHGGVPYNFMLSELFPLLRRVEILVEYDLHRIIEERYRRKLSASELQEILAHERAVAAAEQERLAELRAWQPKVGNAPSSCVWRKNMPNNSAWQSSAPPKPNRNACAPNNSVGRSSGATLPFPCSPSRPTFTPFRA